MAKRKYFSRIFAGYIAIAILYTIIFAAYYYIKNTENIKNDLSFQNKFTLMQIMKNAEMRFSLASEMIERLCADERIIAFAYADKNNQTAASDVISVIRKNTGAVTGKGLTTYVTRFEDTFGPVVGKEAVVTVYDLLASLNLGDMSCENIRSFFIRDENSERNYVRFIKGEGKRNKDTLLIIKRKTAGDMPLYFVQLYDMDTLFGMEEQEGSGLIIFDGKTQICSIGQNTTPAAEALMKVTGSDKDVSSISGRTTERDGFLFEVNRSGVFNWYYVLAVPTSQMTAKSMQLLLLTLAIYGLLLLASAFVMLIMSRRLYRPINQIMDFMSSYNDSGQIGNDEVTYITETVAKIGSVNNHLMEIIQANKVPLKTKFFKDLLFGLVAQEQLSESVEQFKLADLAPPFRVALLEFTSYEILQDAFSKEAILAIKDQINAFIAEQLDGQIIHEVLELDHKRFAIITCVEDLQTLRKLLMNVVMMVEGSFEVEITAAIGESCEDLESLSDSYNSALHILENRFAIGSRNAVLTPEDVGEMITGGFYYPLDIERDLITSVIRLKREEAHKLISKILTENIEKRSLTKGRLNAFIFAITATLNRIIESMNKSTEQIFGEGNIVFLDLKMCSDPAELKEKIHALFDTVMDYVDKENKKAEDDLADQLLDYIHQNYDKDISLLDIGGHFNLSSCYISTLFKNITGENFKDYLSRYRIKKAKEILKKDPSIKNSHLAQMIGCNTVATLFRLFNKYEGMSPGQFAKSLEKQN